MIHQTLKINGQTVDLPPRTFTVAGKKVEFWPGPLVFQVYNRGKVCIGASASLSQSQRLMRKKGRDAGYVLNVCIDHHPRMAWFHVARIVVAQITRQGAESLSLEYLGNSYPEAASI